MRTPIHTRALNVLAVIVVVIWLFPVLLGRAHVDQADRW